MSKNKKGRNPAAVDNWLDLMGLYRKNIAFDETCLFRAVSELLFECQIYHERVRKECIEYGRTNYYEFLDLLDDEQWFVHLDLLEKHMVVCGNLEIELISHVYNCDILIYDAARQQIANVTQRELDKQLGLCLMNEDHYDVVHSKEHIQNAGFCQSIVYNLLYEEVFEIPKVQDIVHGMLYDKEFVSSCLTVFNSNLDTTIKSELDETKDDEISLFSSSKIAPFPFKVAKALDPTIYRNIEYDSWTEVRRELRLGDWYYGDDNLILGTRCIYNTSDAQTFECYIQEIIKTQNKCIVYVTKLAEKRTVNYTDLSPENDAKPWPLPYRFTKNSASTVTPNPTSDSKTLKTPKKRKDKRRLKNGSQTFSTEPHDEELESFIGCPLQMHNTSARQNQQEVAPETPLSQHNLLITPEISSPMPKFSWDAPWSNMSAESNEKFVWTQTTAASPNPTLNVKSMVASTPTMPNVIPYHDYHNPFVYKYNNWISTPEYTPPMKQEEEEPLPTYSPDPAYTEPPYEPQPLKERPPLLIPPPNHQPIELFSPMITVPSGTPVYPGTPIIYAPEVPEMMVQAPSYQVYTPPVDVQYVSPTPYYYSPTVPTSWYPVGINSQGFIFPAPINQNLPMN